ncbi:TPA: hypothetical protein DDZ86_05170 [Candidatus Dependentiae bacterium]|nr:hypothetical protein [Candidatus Dependentiae bacterium]
MIATKIKIVLGILLVEMGGFGAWFLLGDGGMRAQLALKRECVAIESQISDATSEIEHIKYDLKEWRDDSFYVERAAREKLAMSRPGDEVFVLKGE